MSTTASQKLVTLLAIGLVVLMVIAACSAEEAQLPTDTAIPTATSMSEADLMTATPVPAPTATHQPRPSPTTAPQATVTRPPEPTAMPEPTPEPTSIPEQEPTPVPEPSGPKPPQLPVQVIDAEGTEVTVSDVSRIVVLNGDFTEVIFALDMGDNVVAVDVSATYPGEAAALPKVGYQSRLSAEGILAMRPTLVIGNTSAGPPEVIEQIRSTGTPVVILERATTLDGVPRKIRGIAQAIGVAERGEALAAQVAVQIDRVKALGEQAQERPTAVFLYMRGVDSLFMGGRGDLIHELLEASGAISGGAVAGIMAPFVPLTAEALVAANPDCIVVFSTGLETVGGRDGLKALPGVAETAAAQQDCILDFDGQYLAGGGPRTGMVLMDLLRAFHPDLVPAQ